jgi:thiosulfate/3-mercaptopyruvate sulfurtransferase
MLIQPAELAAKLADFQVVDARPSAKFAVAHVPGALSIDANALRSVVSSVDAESVDAVALAALLGKAGVLRDRPLAVYADASDLAASRVLWTLEYMGQTDVRLLDGGFASWSSSGLPTRAGTEALASTNYPADELDHDRRVSSGWVMSHLTDARVALVDARSPAEFAAGHIPGAVNRDWTRNVSEGRLLPLVELERLHAAIPRDKTVVAYCQTGSRASMTYFVLRYLNYPDVRLYDGSMAEWSADPSRPVEQ